MERRHGDEMNMGSMATAAASTSGTPMESMQSMHMEVVFFNSFTTTLYTEMWTPNSPATYAATCIFLVILASALRGLFAAKAVLEHRWLAQARNRRYVYVKGRNSESGNIDSRFDSREASLVSANGVEEKVKVVRTSARGASPFRLTVDIPRALLVMVIAGVGYLLMLAVMTLNIGYFLSILAGHFVGELAAGRFGVWEEH